MLNFLIRYQIKSDKVDEQQAAIRGFIDAIRADADLDIDYPVYQADDGVSFVHHARIPDEATLKALQSRPFFKDFGDGVRTRAADGPTVTRMAPFAATLG